MSKEPYKDRSKVYSRTITVRIPEAVYEALMKRVAKKQEKYPSYTDDEVIRKSIVKHLKEKGLLDKDKNYL